MMLYALSADSPIGKLRLFADGEALVGVHLPEHGPSASGGLAAPLGAGSRLADREHGPDPSPTQDGAGHPVLERARRQLAEYFAGARQAFDLPLSPKGTEFQRSVWRALCAIPFGVTRSYAEIAAGVGRPSARRAVGAANGKNPIAIIVPCHRVIGADGSLTGYGGGLPTKEWLLRHEGASVDPAAASLKRVVSVSNGAQ